MRLACSCAQHANAVYNTYRHTHAGHWRAHRGVEVRLGSVVRQRVAGMSADYILLYLLTASPWPALDVAKTRAK